jgi:two-component system sensor histidine kinase MprB
MFDPAGQLGRGFGAGAPLDRRALIIQRISPAGTPILPGSVRVPVSPVDLKIAASGQASAAVIESSSVGGVEVRVATAGLPGGGAVQVARTVAEANSTLSSLRTRLLLVTLVIAAVAAMIGILLARSVTSALEKLTQKAERIAETGEPDADIDVTGSDEIGRLGRAFSQMLAALSRSRQQQQQLVEDAGHELRTPLTSMRTNIAVLDRFDDLSADNRRRLIDDLRSETGEMAALVDELVNLSAGSDQEPFAQVRVDQIAARAADRASRRFGREIAVDSVPVTIAGQPRALDRAIGNLIENAVKFDSSGLPIEIEVSEGSLTVSDHGRGIPAEQRKAVFERFHRTVEARNTSGSGLGLAIVREVARRHGGEASAGARDDGAAGAAVSFTFASHPSQ